MKKISLISSILILASATAFAYSNPQAGYSINNKNPNFIMETEKVYGYMNLDDRALHVTNYFTAQDMQKLTEEKFTTKSFDDCYNKIAVLDKNNLDKQLIPFKLLDFKRYAKYYSENEALLAKILEKVEKEDLKPDIRLDKIGGRNTVTFSLLHKRNDEIISTNLSFVSANDSLYLLATGVTDKLIYTKNEAEKASKLTQAVEKKEKNHKLEPVDKSKIDATLLQNIWDRHAKFVKLFKTMTPVKSEIKEISYRDNIAGKNIVLPKEWSYVQYNHTDKKNPAILSISFPNAILANCSKKIVEEALARIPNASKLTNEEAATKMGDLLLGELNNTLVTASIVIDKDHELKEILAKPSVAKMQADAFIGESLRRVKKFDNGKVVLNDYKLSTDFKVNYGKIDLTTDVTILGKHNFINQTRFLGAPQKGTFIWVLNKKGEPVDSKVQSIFDKWSF